MRFTLLAVAACGSMAMRPESGRASAMAKIGNLVKSITTRPSDSLVVLKAATGIVNDIFAETGNATAHISGDDAALLGSVVDLVENTIYSSMDQSNDADVSALANGVDTAAACNTDIAHRQSSEGDLGTLQREVSEKQTELNRLQGIVDDKRSANGTAWEAFATHMQMIPTPPACPDLPARNLGSLDVFFEKSEYTMWFKSQQPAYEEYRDAFTFADGELTTAIEAFDVQMARRDTQYCDWSTELESACGVFDSCFSGASDFFSNTLVPRVTSDMNDRIQVKTAGDTLIHQIQFLLAEANEQQTPQVDTSRYEMTFPVLPSKGTCDMSPLADAMWVPTPSCDQDGPGKP